MIDAVLCTCLFLFPNWKQRVDSLEGKSIWKHLNTEENIANGIVPWKNYILGGVTHQGVYVHVAKASSICRNYDEGKGGSQVTLLCVEKKSVWMNECVNICFQQQTNIAVLQ